MSPNFPEKYGNEQECEITASGGILLVQAFKTEPLHDLLTIAGTEYSGPATAVAALHGHPVQGHIHWQSDITVAKSGWKLCLQ